MDRPLLHESILASVSFDYARSGGPGGQNVNKVNSKVIARVALAELLGLSEAEAAQARVRLAARLTVAGELVVSAGEERDQGRNREAALARIERLVAAAAAIRKPRRPTRPTKASKERRLGSKKLRSDSKRLRGRPEES